jgi:hypothetical protein
MRSAIPDVTETHRPEEVPAVAEAASPSETHRVLERLFRVVPALSAVLVSVEFCILIGIFLSFVLYVPRAARVHLTELILTPERDPGAAAGAPAVRSHAAV